MGRNKKIEIYVACHKPSELPQNDLFVPIHVGAKNAKITMPGMRRDDEGDNISEKNPQYCEMTAQYWAWKHSDADYIGLCHYRRYLNFTNKIFTNYTPDNRKQVLVPVLNPYTEKKYGLLDKEKIQEVVENNDILVANAQDLSKVNTPFGPQKTTFEHWKAHDMALINIKDLELLFQIVKEDYPEIYRDMKEYLNTKFFYGFNTFVLRRDLFGEMCSFEFAVLSKLEKKVDISQYNQQLSRIYGFMGEILFSSFVYHIKKTRSDIKIKECQMLYFDKTDPIKILRPQSQTDYTYVFDGTGVPEFLLFPVLSSFLKNMNSHVKYEVVLIFNHVSSFYRSFYSSMFLKYDNITSQLYNVDYFSDEIKEQYGNVTFYPSSFLPWLLPNHKSCLYLRWNTLIQDNCDDLFSTLSEDKDMGAVKDIYYQGKLNTFYKDDKNFAEKVLEIKDIFNVANYKVAFMNLQNLRKIPLDTVIREIQRIEKKAKRKLMEHELFNMLYWDKFEYLDSIWNVLIRSDGDIRFYCNEASLTLNNQQKNADGQAKIVSYRGTAPWYIDQDEAFYLQYWNIIKNSDLENIFSNELVLQHAGHTMGAKEITWTYINTLLPKGSSRREMVKRLFPKKGFIYSHLKKIFNP